MDRFSWGETAALAAERRAAEPPPVDPAAKLALTQHFHHETVVELKVLIGKYVGAQDLL